jgi:hypothetical protein
VRSCRPGPSPVSTTSAQWLSSERTGRAMPYPQHLHNLPL